MDKRFFLFLILSLGILLGSQALINRFAPAPPLAKKQAGDAQQEPDDPADSQKKDQAESDPPQKVQDPKPDDGDDAVPPPALGPAGDTSVRQVTLGSLDPQSGARMLVYFTSRGAAIKRLALNSPRYGDLDIRSGFLGFLGASDAPDGGCLVNVIGPGTPAAKAGLQAGDIVTKLSGESVQSAADLFDKLNQTRPRDTVKLDAIRDGESVGPLSATLVRWPLQLLRPELGTKLQKVSIPGQHDQLSMVFTLEQIDSEKLKPSELELDGVSLRDGNWEITRHDEKVVEFRQVLEARKLVVVKRYELAQADPEQKDNSDAKAYHLTLEVEIYNQGEEPHEVAYRLDGPTGLPTEGWWWSNKIGRNWGGRRLRDVCLHTQRQGPVLIDTSSIVDASEEEGPVRSPLEEQGGLNLLGYLGMDTQYFAAVLIPERETIQRQLFSTVEAVLVGDVPQDKAKRQLSNVTCRLISKPQKITPGADGRIRQSFVLFAGPKRPHLLSQYGPDPYPRRVTLNELIYYGWPIWGWFAIPLSGVLHFFYAITGNYGVAIIMLTIVVRLCMFPLSRKQAINAQKMQELQPEMKRISELYKNDMEKRSRAIQDMYKKHNYNPLAGCLPLFIQLPIFIGLYRALMVDIELRQAPLLSKSIPWADNLAAPDMLWRWEGLLPILVTETGFLGPYLNVLPLVTVVLFIWQQKMFMPPPADEQAAMQQKMMQYMMIFFGFLFFKVPSGLCLYFIVSSLWGLGERKLLPKAQAAAESESAKGKPAAGKRAKQVVKSGSGRDKPPGGKKQKK